MITEKLGALRRLKSQPTLLEFEGSNIDQESGMIRDVVMLQEGPAQGHGVELEAEFVENIVAYDVRYFSKIGLKARFDHPGASSGTMGSQLGIFSNFRTREKKGKMQAIADLQLLDSAELSPTHPGMKSWVLSMAEERPDFIMSSIVFQGSAYYQRTEDGKKKKLTFDEYGYAQNYDPERGPVYVEFDAKKGAAHYYTDLVEAGAATDHLFSNAANPHLFVARLGSWLDDNPDIRIFVQEHPDQVQAFLDRVGFKPSTTTPSPKMKNTNFLQKLFGGAATDEEVTLSATELKTLRDGLAAAETALAEMEQIKTDLAALKTEKADTDTALAAAQQRIEELEKMPAAEHTKVTGSDDDGGEVKSWMKNPINQRALATRQRKA